jgi:type III restriction enzyme
MQLTLMDFQTTAVEQTLKTLGACRRDWVADREQSAFALSAPTGSGKTVIASAVIEALLHGSDEYGVEPDPKAVILWVTKDPALNEQTRNRIIATADRIPVGTLHVVDNNFTDDQLTAGHVYFINTAKLSITSLLTRKSNARQTTFWEVLDNTIRNPQRTLFVILDEAHEGMKPIGNDSERERLTLVRKIIDGDNGYAAAPVVWGLSATIDRFSHAMAQTKHRTMRPPVAISPAEVQESGLLKSSLALTIPDEKGDFTTTLTREAAIELAAITTRWAGYCATEQITPVVRPLMVIQVPNKEKGNTDEEDRLIRSILDTVKAHLPGFTTKQVGHVLGDRDTLSLGDYTIDKVAPETVAGDPDLRVLIAKDAVSTGWDCPRAEVLVSLRPAKDRTYITQLLGRMVRTPLARSTSDDLLNAASAYLPLFDRTAAQQVADDIMGVGAGGGVVGPTVMLNPVTLVWNKKVPDGVKALLEGLPSMPKPAVSMKPVKRMLGMAIEMSNGHVEDPTASSIARLCAVIDGIIAEYHDQVELVAAGIRTAELRRMTVSLAGTAATDLTFKLDADARTVEDAVRAVRRILTPAIVNAWTRAKYTAAKAIDPDTDLTLIQARLAAVALVDTGKGKTVEQRIDDAADDQVGEWFDLIRAALPTMKEARRTAFEKLRAQARVPQETAIALPVSIRVDLHEPNGNVRDLLERHVFANPDDGKMPLSKPTSWESQVIVEELKRDTVKAWYRNPSAGGAALQVAYQDASGVWRSVQPDFLIVEENADGVLGCSIVDPHGHHLADAMAKLHALAGFAERFADRFNRVDAVSKPDLKGPLRVLELHRPEVRSAVLAGTDAKSLFESTTARNY